MYAVFVDDTIVYLGTKSDKATAILNLNAEMGAMMVTVSTLEELAQFLLRVAEDAQRPSRVPKDARKADLELARHLAGLDQIHEETESTLSQAANRVLQILNDAGINAENAQKYADAVREQSKKVAAEVKSKGIEGMKVVGDSFVALGELLRGNGQNKPGCGGDNLSD